MQTDKLQFSEISVSYYPRETEMPEIKGAKSAYEVLKHFFPQETMALQERFVVIYLNKSNKLMGVYPTCVGGLTTVLADVRLIMAVALKTASTSIIISHNHPSGALRPSQQDLDLTQKVKEAGRLLDIKVLDHIILVPEEGAYYSMADEGVM
jgi:DNA repair protein RadC